MGGNINKRIMKIAIVYHRIDSDGLCSYAVLYKALTAKPYIYPNAVIAGIGYNHDDELPDLSGYDIVYVADIALPVDVMKKLNEEGRLIWIDHHVTSMEDAKANGYYLSPGIRTIGKVHRPAAREGRRPFLVNGNTDNLCRVAKETYCPFYLSHPLWKIRNDSHKGRKK